MNRDGYGISESDLFVHPRGLFAEHGAQQFRDPRIKALLRQWQLDKLPHDLNSPETRRIVAERELASSACCARLTVRSSPMPPCCSPPSRRPMRS
jgi:hypothetical protein